MKGKESEPGLEPSGLHAELTPSTLSQGKMNFNKKHNSYHRVHFIHAGCAAFVDRVDKLRQMFEVSCHLGCHHHIDDRLTNCTKDIPREQQTHSKHVVG